MEEGEEMTIRYYDWMECKLCIRKDIKEKWFFDCCCVRCQSPTDLGTYVSSPKCSDCKSGKMIPVEPLNHKSDWTCEKCSALVGFEIIAKIEQDSKDLIKKMETENAQPQEIIDQLNQSLSCNHHLILKLKHDVVVEGKYPQTSLESIVEYSKDMLPIIDTLDGDLSLSKGKVALKLAQSQLEVFKRKFQEKAISKQELMKEVQPYIRLQLEAKKLIF